LFADRRTVPAARAVAGRALLAFASSACIAVVGVAIADDSPRTPGATAPTPAYVWRLPRGFPLPYVPPDNPMSVAKVELGRRLFFDTRLSVTGRYSCASCHEPARAYTDGRAKAIGATGGDVGRGAMSLTNVAYAASFGWFDTGAASLEAQMRTPLYNEHPVEIGLTGREDAVVAALAADASYAAAFAAGFPGNSSPISIENLIRAIAAFERTLISGDSAFDRYVFRGEHAALDAQAKRGMELFYSRRLGCGECHAGFAFTGATRDAAHPDAKPAFARNGTGERAARIPTLRNVALTAPYMHDGRFATLEDVIEHYERAGRAERVPTGARSASRSTARDAPRLRSFTLTPDERGALVAFLHSLTE
jgi:cytochrome c peroxidase